MREVVGDLWAIARGEWKIITTNGALTKANHAILGAGIARQAKQRYPDLPRELGQRIADGGNHVEIFPQWLIVTMPTKHHWKDATSDLALIERSAVEVVNTRVFERNGAIYSVRVGTGCGNLSWDAVKPILERHWDDRFVIVNEE